LECLTRPNFFCGQLLTDGDLKAMVDWIETKSALKRFREGWGVACGLDVTCSHKDKEQTRVYVSEGYAVDCCGRDIVVCDPLWYDFKCEKPFDPCCREAQPAQDRNQSRGGAAVEPRLGGIPLSELRAFDLCLRFDEAMSGGQRAIARGDCSPMGDCQYTRVKEKGKLVATEVKDPCLAPTNLAESKYRSELKLFLADLEKRRSSPKDLLGWIPGRLHSFCFVEESLCMLVNPSKDQPSAQPATEGQTGAGTAARAPEEEIFSNLIFYIVQDWRNHYFECVCESCRDNACEGDGVPLARVWVWDKRVGDCKKCNVVYIDSYPPYRRLLSRECSPVHPGCIDLSRYVWRDAVEARQELARSGFTDVKPLPMPTFSEGSIKEFLATLAGEHDLTCAPPGSSLAMKVFPDLCGRNRVVSFEISQK